MYVSVRDVHLPGVFGSIKSGLQAMGLDAIEMNYSRERTVGSLDTADGPPESLVDKAAIEAFAYKCRGLGIRVSSFLMSNNFGNPDTAAEIEWAISALKAAGQLGVKTVRIDAIMRVEGDWSFEKRTKHFADCMRKVLDATSGLDVEMGIENHGREGNDPEFLDTIINAVNSPRLGVTVDTGNFYWSGKPLETVLKVIERFAGRVKHTHMKSINYPEDKRNIQRETGWEYGTYASPLREGDLDIPRIVATLKKAGYKNDLCIENESLGRFDKEKQKAVLIDDAAYLKEILAR